MTRNCANETLELRRSFRGKASCTRSVDVPYVAVEDEPKHHELWRTASFRVLRADFPKRSSCLWHEHTRCTVYICITAVDVIEHKYGLDSAPLKLEKGAVMCRDHSVEPLIHTATTKDEDVIMVGVEFLQRTFERTQQVENEINALATQAIDVQRVYSDARSCVDKFELRKAAAATLKLQSEAVLVALDPCELIVNAASGKGDTHNKTDAGHALHMQAGRVITLHLDAHNDSCATFYLVQVFH